LKIDGKELFTVHPLDELRKDAIALLLFGKAHIAMRMKKSRQL